MYDTFVEGPKRDEKGPGTHVLLRWELTFREFPVTCECPHRYIPCIMIVPTRTSDIYPNE